MRGTKRERRPGVWELRARRAALSGAVRLPTQQGRRHWTGTEARAAAAKIRRARR